MLSMNLISVEQLADMNCFVGFDDSSSFMQDRRTRIVIGIGHRQRGSIGLYVLNCLSLPLSSISGTTPAPIPLSSVVSLSTPCPSTSTSVCLSFHQWHHRLGHLCGSRLSILIHRGVLSQSGFVFTR